MIDGAVEVRLQVPMSRISDLITSAIEGGSSDWLTGFYLKGTRKTAEQPWYASPDLFQADFEIEFLFDDPMNPATQKRVLRTRQDFINALSQMSREFPSHFGDILSESDDAFTADTFMQLVAFGEHTYA